jgi:hypothetical protein
VLSVESVDGPGIAAKGLRPDQAQEARELILDKTRPPRLAARNGGTEPTPAPAPAPVARAVEPRPAPVPVDAPALRAKLADLHKAGVLTDDEYQQKLLVVRRLASGETMSGTSR